MRNIIAVLCLCAMVRAQDPDDTTLAGMDAVVRGDWVSAVESFRKALADNPRGSTRLRAARDQGTEFFGAEIDRLLKAKRLEHAAYFVALALRVNPDYRKFKGAAKRLARAGITAPEIPSPDDGPYSHRSTRGRFRAGLRQGADYSRAETLLDGCLRFLLGSQSDDGRWDSDAYGGQPAYDTGVTALAMLALLCRGRDALQGQSGDALHRAALWLKAQEKGGAFGNRATPSHIYCSAFAAKALAEYAVIADKIDEWKPTLARASTFLVEAQNPGMGWRYEAQAGESDTAVTTRVLDALVAMQKAGISVPKKAFAGALAWVDRMTDPNYGQIGYNVPGGEPARPEGNAKLFPPEHSQAMTAAGCLVCLYGGRSPASIGLGLELVHAVPPKTRYADRYYWEQGARALQAAYGSVPPDWYGALVDSVQDGVDDSGAVVDEGVWASDGGRIYSTAISALALAAPYNEAPTSIGWASAFIRTNRRMVGVSGRAAGIPTGIYVDSGTRLLVSVSGTIYTMDGSSRDCGPKGLKRTPAGAERLAQNFPFACLLGRVGQHGKPFRVKRGAMTMRATGQLFLFVNDADLSDNSRGWKVTLELVRQ